MFPVSPPRTRQVRAVVLAAGRGERLRPRTDETPKGLITLGDESLLRRLVRQCVAAGIENVHIVLGYRGDRIRAGLSDEGHGARLHFTENPDWECASNARSMRLGLDAVNEADPDCLVLTLECDVVLRDGILDAVVEAAQAGSSIAVVSPFGPGMNGTAVRLQGDRVVELVPGVRTFAEDGGLPLHKTVNVALLQAAMWQALRAELSGETGDAAAFYELSLGPLIDDPTMPLTGLVLEAGAWWEVDDEQDLRHARITFDDAAATTEAATAHGGFWDFPFLDFVYLRNMHFPPPALVAELRAGLPTALENYGSAQSVLDRKLAWLMSTDADCTVALSGASQAYPLLARELGRVLIPAPTFGEYEARFPDALRYPAAASAEDISRAISVHEPTTVVVVNPNNPTGTLHGQASLLDLIRSHPGITFLVDESFLGFTSVPSLMQAEGPPTNLLVLTSLSKTHGIPGLRLGMLWSANRARMAAVRAQLPIWSVNSLAEMFLTASLRFQEDLAASYLRTQEDKLAFEQLLGTVRGVSVVGQVHGNFVLASIGRADVSGPWVVAALRERGFLVKDVTARLGATEPTLRLAVRTQGDHERLVQALDLLVR